MTCLLLCAAVVLVWPCSAWLYMGIVVDLFFCMRLARYMRIHVGLKAFYQVRLEYPADDARPACKGLCSTTQ